MKKLKSPWSFKKHYMFSLLIPLVIEIIGRFLSWHDQAVIGKFLSWNTHTSIDITESSSIGIIGGADGPTAVFVTSGPNNYFLLNLICIILFALIVILYKPIKNLIEK